MSLDTDQQQKTRQKRKGIIFHKILEKAALGGAIFLGGIAVIAAVGVAVKLLLGG